MELKNSNIDFEIIAINDGSTDSSLSIIQQLSLGDERIKVFNYKNGGPSVARNRGLEHCTKDYIIFLDSDDKVNACFLLNIYKKCVTKKLDCFLYSSSVFYDQAYSGDEFDFNYIRPRDVLNTIMSGDELLNKFMSLKDYQVSACMYMFKKDLLKGHKFLKNIYHEDNLFTVRLLLLGVGKRFYCSDIEVYQRRFRNGSIMTMPKNHKHVEGYLAVYHALKQDIIQAKDIKLIDSLKQFSFKMLLNANIVLLSSGVLYRPWTWNYRFNILRLFFTDFDFLYKPFFLIQILLPEAVLMKMLIKRELRNRRTYVRG